MNKYKNTTPFPMIIDLKSGRRILNPNEIFESDEELNIPGILKEGFVEQKTLEVFPQKSPLEKLENPMPVKNALESLFSARFRR